MMQDAAPRESVDCRCVGSMDIIDINQQITYTVCPKCDQTQKAVPEETFFCDTCKEDQIAAPRSKIMVHITDESRTTPATLFDRNADKLLHLTPKQAAHMDSKPHKALAEHLRETNSGLKEKQIIARVNAKKYGDNVIRYTIQDWAEYKATKLIGESSTQTKEHQLSIDESTSQEHIGSPKQSHDKEEDSVTKKRKDATTIEGTPTPEKTSGPNKKLHTNTP